MRLTFALALISIVILFPRIAPATTMLPIELDDPFAEGTTNMDTGLNL